jgi:hypothetical protein
MTFALIAALIFAGHVWLVDRKDRRHQDQIDRLLLARTDPEVLRVAPEYDGPLYSNTTDADLLPEKAED